MQGSARIPRWVVENDPSWEKSVDSNLGMLRWTKKGAGVTAVCSPTSMFCDILGHEEPSTGLPNLESAARKMHAGSAGPDDIAKYLSSRYLNPGINGPRPDIRRFRSF